MESAQVVQDAGFAAKERGAWLNSTLSMVARIWCLVKSKHGGGWNYFGTDRFGGGVQSGKAAQGRRTPRDWVARARLWVGIVFFGGAIRGESSGSAIGGANGGKAAVNRRTPYG